MGFRYRKSVNFGGGFRVNISKSGIGYSWGIKGYRITKTASGNVRQTASIPGTGFSYVTETSKKKASQHRNGNLYDTEQLVNDVASGMVSDGLEGILAAAKKTILANKVANIGLVASAFLSLVAPPVALLFLAFLALKVYAKTAGIVKLDYEIEDDQKDIVAQQMAPMLRITESKKAWRVVESSKVVDKRYSGGASSTIKRVPCNASQSIPFPFKANTPAATFKAGKETLVFLPDKLFVMQGSKIGALNYADISVSTNTTRFHETESVPNDATVIGHTWAYVNKSGEPDKRFKNNRKIPICLYGEMELKSSYGLNTDIMFSNSNLK